MPVILPREAYAEWLDPALTEARHLSDLLVAAPEDWLAATPVGTHVNAVAHDDPECVAPLTD